MRQPVARRTLVDRVAEAILDSILDGGIAPGSALPSAGELAERYDVSVVVVREALAVLAGRGIVLRRQGREPVASRPGPEILDSIFRVRMQQDSMTLVEFQQCRAALELQSAALATSNPSQQARDDLLALPLELMRTETEIAALATADAQFHQALAELSGNAPLRLILSSFSTLLHQSIEDNVARLLASRGREGISIAFERHRAITDAVVDGDRRRAVSAMASHFMIWTEIDYGNLEFAVPETGRCGRLHWPQH